MFPVRLVWLPIDETEGVKILISASKRHFHHAVDRNRVKRQVREFYRTSASPLKEKLSSMHKGLLLAFLFSDSRLWSTDQLHQRLATAMDRLLAELSKQESGITEQNPE